MGKIQERQRLKEEQKRDERLIFMLDNDLSNFIHEFRSGTVTEEEIYSFFKDILYDVDAKSELMVKVLEKPLYGEPGKDAALAIKVNEGW